uniref:Rab GDP dissociation inhibitor n=1 Tax=Proboscia inermis TaxID=420281 RepID=A0A7S0CCT9_9STRA|mmetsp:Transcript_39901/g.40534  ORF Transcript_39901/g.40534 Transcript_39901/m.40534 type:complete len:466 (+) Transcript_39901:37-1434(+)
MADEQEAPPKPTFDWLPEGKEPLADGEYDAIVMGTGLKECVISGLLSVEGKKVLHIDRNNYYGAECASLNLTNLYEKFKAGDVPNTLGTNRDYNVDLIPKFVMACGNLTKMLLHSKVTRYLEFKSIGGSYVQAGGKILKVPATPEEALKSSLMGIFEKRRFRKFIIFVNQYAQDKPATFEGRDLTVMTMRELYLNFGLVPATHEFISHAMCLELDEVHLDKPALSTVLNLQIYCHSLERYGTSPYIYPIYGLGGLPEGFSRLCAIHGGTFMLNRDVDEVLIGEDGKAYGVMAGNEMAKAKMVIGDPSYFPKSMVRATGQVVRSICFLNHPIPNTNDMDSAQIIIPGPQVGRVNDIFVCSLSSGHNVSAKGVYIAIVSTKMEKGQPEEEVKPGLELLGNIMQRFTSVATTYEPVGSGKDNNCYISSSFDGTSHFESDCDDMLSLYERVTGKKLDMTINADSVEADY